MKKLENRYDHEKLLTVLHSTNIVAPQVHVTSPTGKDYVYSTGDLSKFGLEQNTFTVMNEAFVGTYVEEVYNDIAKDYDICRGRFMSLTPENRAYTYHYDMSKRLHIPLVTNKDCMFLVNDVVYRMDDLGALYELDTLKKHTALNLSNKSRVHFVVCLKSTFNMNDYIGKQNADRS